MRLEEESRLNPLLAFTEQWLEAWKHACLVGRGSLEAFAFFADPRWLRKFWLADLSQAMDRYMRSAVFLELMQVNLNYLARSARGVFQLRTK